MTTTLLVLIVVGIVLACIAVGITVGIHNAISDVFSSVACVVAGIILGVCFTSNSMVDYLHGYPPRNVDLSDVRWTGDVLTLPTPTEVGAKWYVVIKTGTGKTSSNGVYAPVKDFSLPTGLNTGDVEVYMGFPDGRTSTQAPVTKM